MELAARGERDAAATVAIETLGPAILGYLRALHGDPDDAQDAFQLWAEDVWKGVASLRSGASLRGWAYRIAFHASSRFRRDAWRRRRERLQTSAASRIAASVVPSATLGGRDERLDILGKDLEPEDRTLLLLRLDLGMSWEEIAGVLAREGADLGPAALRKRYQRLKERLGALAREKGLVGDQGGRTQ